MLLILKIIAFIGLYSAGSLLWAQQQSDKKEMVIQSAEPVSAQKAYIDPETGELTDQPPSSSDNITSNNRVEENAELPPMEVTTHADGTVQIDLNGRFRTPLQARIGCDGQIITMHSKEALTDNTDCEE